MQHKVWSAVEAITNVASGMAIAWCLMQYVLAPAMEINISPAENTVVTICLTAVSMVRGYCWRRFFNYLETEKRRKHGRKS